MIQGLKVGDTVTVSFDSERAFLEFIDNRRPKSYGVSINDKTKRLKVLQPREYDPESRFLYFAIEGWEGNYIRIRESIDAEGFEVTVTNDNLVERTNFRCRVLKTADGSIRLIISKINQN